MYSRNNWGFLIRPKPVVGESFIGYLYRLARVNGLNYEALALLFKNNAAPIKSYDVDDREKIKATAYKLTGHEIDLFDPWRFYLGYRPLFDYKKLKICPECFAENLVYDAKWHSRLSFTCAKHRCFLIDQCPICSADIDANTFIYGECGQCHTKIRQMSSDVKFESIDPVLSNFINETTRGQNLEQHKFFVSKLEFYMYLVNKNAFSYWDRRRDAKLALLNEIIDKALFLISNIEESKRVMLDMYCYPNGLNTIIQGTFSRFLKLDDSVWIKNLYRHVVEEYAQFRSDDTVLVSLIAFVYTQDIEKIFIKSDALNVRLIKKQGGNTSMFLADLPRLIASF